MYSIKRFVAFLSVLRVTDSFTTHGIPKVLFQTVNQAAKLNTQGVSEVEGSDWRPNGALTTTVEAILSVRLAQVVSTCCANRSHWLVRLRTSISPLQHMPSHNM
jgi:hypothetical protein